MSGRWARRARWLAAAGAITAAAAIGAGWLVMRTDAAEPWLRAQIAARLDAAIRVETARVEWWPQPGLVLGGVTMPLDDGQSATAERVECRVAWAPLLRGIVVLRRVAIEGVRATLTVGPTETPRQGALPATERIARWARIAGGGPLPQITLRRGDVMLRGATGNAATALHIVRARVTPAGAGARATLAIRVPPAGSVRAEIAVESLADLPHAAITGSLDAMQLDLVSLSPWWSAAAPCSATGTLRLAASGSGTTAAAHGELLVELADGAIQCPDWHASAPLRVRAQPTWNGRTVELAAGSAHAAAVASGDVVATEIAGAFGYADGVMQIDSLVLRAAGATWRAAGRVQPGPPAAIDGTISGTISNVAAFAAALAPSGMSPPIRVAGPVQIDASGHVAGDGWRARVRAGAGGDAAWNGARAVGPLEIEADLNGRGIVVDAGSGQARASRVALAAIAADAFESTFVYADGTLRLPSLRANLLGAALRYSGSVPVAGQQRWGGDLGADGMSVTAIAALAGRTLPADCSGTVTLAGRVSGVGTTAVSTTATVRVTSDELACGAAHLAAPAQLTGTMALTPRGIQVSTAHAEAARVQVAGLQAAAFNAALSADAATIRISSAQAHAYGGQWHASGHVALADPTRSQARIDGAHVDLDALLAAVAEPDLRATAARADLHAELTGGDTAQGRVGMTLRAGTVTWGPLAIDAPAHAKGAIRLAGGALAVRGVDAGAARAAFGTLVGTNAGASFDYANDRLDFHTLHFTAAGGAWTHSGWFTLEPHGTFAGQLTIAGAAPKTLAAMIDQPSLDLPFTRLDADSEFRGTADTDWLPHLHATGTVFLSDGVVPSATVLRPIFEGLVGPGRIRTELDRPTRIAQLGGPFDLRRGTLESADLSVVSDDYRVTAIGSIGLGGGLDLSARIQLTAAGVKKMFLLGAVPLPTGVLPPLPPIPSRITGTMRDPVIRPNMGALPGSTARWFVDAVLGVPRSITGAILDRAGGIWRRLRGK